MNDFADHIIEGLSKKRKTLSSLYFYDEKGTELFQSIMKMPEYYLTNSEYEILETQSNKIYEIIKDDKPINLVEFGSGDGSKTKLLLKELLNKKLEFKFTPVDISIDALNKLKSNLLEELKDLKIDFKNMDYFHSLDLLNKESRNVLLFMGSNIGNYSKEQANDFLNKINQKLKRNDFLITGIDLKKDPRIINDAYNDPHGITSEFNLNLLDRINREFDGNFDRDKFVHHQLYDPISGEARSFIVSLKDQVVTLNKLNKDFTFKYGEEIHTEVSRKYTLDEISDLAENSNFELIENLFDCKHYFCVSIWRKK